jgi:hypothetical protein
MSQFEKITRESKIQKLVETQEPLASGQCTCRASIFDYPIYISPSYNLVKYMSTHFLCKKNGNKKCWKKSHYYVRGLKSEESIKEGAYITAKIP